MDKQQDKTEFQHPLDYGTPKEQTQPSDVPNSPKTLQRPIILGDLTLASPTTQTTIGANGTATALTANPVGYLTILIGNVPYQIPYYSIA